MNCFDHGYALLIGVNDCEVKKWALPGVLKDLQELKKVLVDPERCSYPKENIKVLTGPDATRNGILEGLKWLNKRIQEDATENATAIIYYSGHGWRDESSETPAFYLIPYDVKEQKISSNALSASQFARKIASLNPRRLLVVLDCCHAGGMRVKDLGGLPEGFTAAAIPTAPFMEGEKSVWKPGEMELNTLTKGNGRAVLSSSTEVQRSYFRRDNDMSIFTYHLIEALTGHARPREGAAEVLVSDVMSYVWRRVPESARNDWGQEQIPDYSVNGNFPIALLLGGEGKSLLVKTDDLVQIGLERLELEDYEAALESFQKARVLMPEDEKIQVYYYITSLAGKPIMSFNKQDMNAITISLKKIVAGNDLEASNLARLLLGIIWFDYYVKIDHHYQELFFKTNTRYLGNYYPPKEERKLIEHIVCTNSAKNMFNLS